MKTGNLSGHDPEIFDGVDTEERKARVGSAK